MGQKPLLMGSINLGKHARYTEHRIDSRIELFCAYLETIKWFQGTLDIPACVEKP